MKNYAMTICYDGTRYQGWQRQTNTDKSIQGKIEDVLSKMCSHRVEIHGSGRTDAGVHAKGQVASFKIDTEKSTDEIRDYLNEYLPKDIAVTEVREMDERFHARLTRCRKTYLYRINNSNISKVFERKYVYQITKKLDVEKMRVAAKMLEGEHDFVGFSSLKKVKKSTTRTVYDVNINEADNIEIYITADGFLYNMVRIIVGTLIEIGLNERATDDLLKVFETKDRENAGKTAPAQGLMLYNVQYED